MKKQGFSLIETVIAMTIMVTILVSGASLLSTLFTSHINNQNRVTATYLAQECLEISRNNRDTNWLQNKPWDKNLSKNIPQIHGIFTRTIEIIAQKTDEKEISCTIRWENVSGEHQITMNQILTNWRKK